MGNLSTVQAMYRALGRRDLDAVRELLAPDIEWIQSAGFPGGGRHVGADAVLEEVFARFATEWSDWQAVVHQWLDAGETIVALGEYRGTYKATARSTVAAFAHVYDLRDGRIVCFRQYADTAKICEATLA
jgi:ketosteroid isomerase-like protein